VKRNTGPQVDAEPVRQHVRELMAAGVSYPRIAQAAGVSTATVNHLLYNRYNRAPSGKINHENARLILAVRADQVATGFVDPTGSARRIQALMAIGWPPMHLGPRIGRCPGYVNEIQRRPLVLATTAHAVAQVYNQLWNKKPEHHGVSRQAATRFRNYARAKGWPPPAAWDDDALDDPTRGPEADDEPELNRNELAAYRRQEIAHLASFGIPEQDIAARLGISDSTVQQQIRDMRKAA
jgi:DNA-binding CsgD family transcriptional regulator